MNRRTIAVVSAGLSQPSSTRLLADQLVAAVRAELEHDGEVTVVLVELRDLGHDLVNHLLTGFPSPALQRAIDDVVGADGLVAVTPVFSASYSGLFKSFFDVLDAHALQGMPVLIGATGGTARHSLALEHAVRPLFAYLRALVVPTAVYAASEDWASAEDGTALADRIARAGHELARLVRADLHPAGVGGRAVEDDFTPFEEMLLGR